LKGFAARRKAKKQKDKVKATVGNKEETKDLELGSVRTSDSSSS
jgi:hypothetical protein